MEIITDSTSTTPNRTERYTISSLPPQVSLESSKAGIRLRTVMSKVITAVGTSFWKVVRRVLKKESLEWIMETRESVICKPEVTR